MARTRISRGLNSVKTAVVLSLIASLPTSVNGEAEESTDPLLSAWLSAHQDLKTWSADFMQTRSLAALAHPLVSTGRVYYAMPGLLRWEVGNPAQTIALRVTNEILVAYPALKRVERYPLDDTMTGPMRDALLLMEAGFPRGQDALLENYVFSSKPDTNNLCHFTLQPRETSNKRMVSNVTLTFNTNGFLLSSTRIEFADGSTLQNDFFHGRSNNKLGAGVFSTNFLEGFKITEPLKR